MLFWTTEVSRSWCQRQRLHLDPYNLSMNSAEMAYRVRYCLPRDSGRTAALCNNFRNLTGIANDALILVLAWGIFPSSENEDIFTRYRLSFGEARSLAEAPGHFISSGEESTFASITQLCMMSFWDCLVVDADLPIFALFDHDDRLEISTTSQELRDKAIANFGKFGLFPITP